VEKVDAGYLAQDLGQDVWRGGAVRVVRSGKACETLDAALCG
jgi:hypothetical protein